MSVPVFEHVTAGLYRLSTLAESGLEHYWAGYLASPGSDLGASASLAQTWADQGGAYLFCANAPADPATFVADLRALWPRLSPKGWLRLLWIANPADSASQSAPVSTVLMAALCARIVLRRGPVAGRPRRSPGRPGAAAQTGHRPAVR